MIRIRKDSLHSMIVLVLLLFGTDLVGAQNNSPGKIIFQKGKFTFDFATP